MNLNLGNITFWHFNVLFIKLIIEIIQYIVGNKRTISPCIFNSTVIILGEQSYLNNQ